MGGRGGSSKRGGGGGGGTSAERSVMSNWLSYAKYHLDTRGRQRITDKTFRVFDPKTTSGKSPTYYMTPQKAVKVLNSMGKGKYEVHKEERAGRVKLYIRKKG